MRIRWLHPPTVAALLALTACTGSGSTPATAPSTSAATTTTATTAAPTSEPAPSTTSTTVDRLTEIQQIFEDLERRRLDALYRGDVEAFSALFANEAYLERSLEAFELVEFTGPPNVSVRIVRVIEDRDGCLAADTELARQTGGESSFAIVVLEPVNSYWGFSYIGEGWVCDGSHPLER